MQETNRALIPIPIGHNSVFAPSMRESTILAIFVHGFRGRALSTWLSFPDFLDNRLADPSNDALFYGFRSRPQRLAHMANRLRDDMDIMCRVSCFLVPIAARSSSCLVSKNRSSVCFIVYSFLYCAVRLAVIDALTKSLAERSGKGGWAENSTMCLFAPAHSGSNIVKLVGESFPRFTRPVEFLLKIHYPCLADLEKGSDALTRLAEDYEKLPQKVQKLATATRVVFAELDNVVEPPRFKGDPVEDQIKGVGHVDVVKPNSGFLDPIHHVKCVFEKINGPEKD